MYTASIPIFDFTLVVNSFLYYTTKFHLLTFTYHNTYHPVDSLVFSLQFVRRSPICIVR
jgi:hypothetical protein